MHESDQHMLSRMMDGEWDELDPSRCAAIVCEDPVARARWARYHMIRDVLNNEPVHIGTDLASRVRLAIDDEPAYSNVAKLQAAGTPGSAAAEPVVPGVNRELTQSTDESGQVPASVTPGDETVGVASLPEVPMSGQAVSNDVGTRPWGRAVAGLAVAASMALVTVVGLNLLEQGRSGPAAGSAAVQVAATQNPVVEVAQGSAGDPPAAASSGSLPGTVLPQIEFVANRGSHWVTGDQKRQAATESRLNMFLSQHIENSPTGERQGMLPYSRLVGYDELPAK